MTSDCSLPASNSEMHADCSENSPTNPKTLRNNRNQFASNVAPQRCMKTPLKMLDVCRPRAELTNLFTANRQPSAALSGCGGAMTRMTALKLMWLVLEEPLRLGFSHARPNEF